MKDSKLKTARLGRNLTVASVAAIIDSTPGQVSRIERGLQRPSLDDARALFELYAGEVSLGEIHDPTYRP